MRRIATLSVLLLIIACGTATPAPTTAALTSTTTLAETTTTTAPPVTTPPAAQYTTDDCGTPPVTFALLCNVYELLASYHVDSPLDPSTLAAGAALGVESYESSGAGEQPESFVCAIPDPAFETTCSIISERLRAGPLEIDEAIESGVSSMISLSLDPFTYYLPPELSGALTEDGVVNAVGLLLTIRDPVGSTCAVIQAQCRLEITLVMVEGPSFEAGVRAGDILTAVDGTPVEGSTLIEVAGLLDGPEGSTVTLQLERGDEEPEEIVVERRPPSIPQLEAEVLPPGVGYIRLPDFGVDVPEFLHSTLAAWEAGGGVDNLVLDLRDNPGGFVDVATLVASEFLPDGLVLRSESPAETLDYPVQDGGLATTGPPLTVVVNAGSASASEILAGVLQERERAEVVGEATFGKDTVQIGFPLRNDGELRVTVAHWVTPEGATVAGGGVIPDVMLEIPADAPAAEVVDLVLG
ncbi:MAG TPA: S41 family peptidase [Acidimicrobiia bacterium]|nr:S41 family peptidase [Acidimicrobiia bacterium]